MGNEFNLKRLISGHVLPPLPPFIKENPPQLNSVPNIDADVVDTTVGDKIERTIFGTPQVVPLLIKLKSEADYWLFPVETLISIDGKNILIKRNVAKKKGRGSIKEYWTEDDYTINIQGMLTTPGTQNFPDEDLKRLITYCTAKEPLDVLCPALDRLGIKKIVIEDYSLPFTKGPENQNFSIKALSDDDGELLIKKNTNVL